MITVRTVTSADAPRWSALRAALWPDEPTAELATEAAAYLEGKGFMLEIVLVADDDDAREIVGFAEVSLRPYADGCTTTPVGFLEGWYVVPELRGRGVGRALVAASEDWAREQGCKEFASDTQYDNAPGAAAHEALGFEQVETLRCFRKSLE